VANVRRPPAPRPAPLAAPAALQAIRRYDPLAVLIARTIPNERVWEMWKVVEVLLAHPGLRVLWGNWHSSSTDDDSDPSGWSLSGAVAFGELDALELLLQVEGTAADLRRCTHECAQAQAQLQVRGRAARSVLAAAPPTEQCSRRKLLPRAASSRWWSLARALDGPAAPELPAACKPGLT
jgi:hypothetical protein